MLINGVQVTRHLLQVVSALKNRDHFRKEELKYHLFIINSYGDRTNKATRAALLAAPPNN
ncbi:hypothetical protein C5955_07100 [Cronobacter sakazakii]|nr:hypothetical protein C5955_07100 [Cronobacter sakazakii]